nr:MAG TPA: hypothetical protein [Caudoviricetes sp.]
MINASVSTPIEKIASGMDFTGYEFNRRLQAVDINFKLKSAEIERAIDDLKGISPVTSLLFDLQQVNRNTSPVVNSIHIGVPVAGYANEAPIAWQNFNFRNPHGGDIKSWANGVGPSGYATISSEWLATMLVGASRQYDGDGSNLPAWNKQYGSTYRHHPLFYRLPTRQGTVNGIGSSGFAGSPLAQAHGEDGYLATRWWARQAVRAFRDAMGSILGVVFNQRVGGNAPFQYVIPLGREWCAVVGRASTAPRFGSFSGGTNVRLVSICGSQLNMNTYPFAGEVYTFVTGSYGDGHNYGGEVAGAPEFGGRPALRIRVAPEGANSGDYRLFDVFYLLIGQRDNSSNKPSALNVLFR